jgi:hypothetical protein
MHALDRDVSTGGAAPDFASRAAARLPSVRRVRRSPGAVAAACMLLGVVVVVVAATARHESRGAAAVAPTPRPAPGVPDPGRPQDPQSPAPAPPRPRVVAIDMAAVKAACPRIVAPPPGPAIDRLRAIAQSAKRSLVCELGALRESRVTLAGCCWREAIALVAEECAVTVREFGEVVVITRRDAGEPAPRPSGRMSLRKDAVPVEQVWKALHARGGLDLVVASDVAGVVRVDVEGVPAGALLATVAAQLRLQVGACGGVFAVRRPTLLLPPTMRLAISLSGDDLAGVAEALALVTGKTLVLDPALATARGNALAVHCAMPVEADLLTALARVAAADPRDEVGIVRLVPWLQAPAPVGATMERVAVAELARLIAPEVSLVTGAAALLVHAWIARAEPADVLRAAAFATGQRFVRRERVYAIE